MHNILKIYKNGKLHIKDGTIMLEIIEDGKVIGHKKKSIEDKSAIYIFGQVDISRSFIEYISRYYPNLLIFFFDYYKNFISLLTHKNTNQSNKVLIEQVRHNLEFEKRSFLAKEFLKAGLKNVINNIKYYKYRGAKISKEKMDLIENRYNLLNKDISKISQLMAIEGNIRANYYEIWDKFILNGELKLNKREYYPPKNEVNALLSYLNIMLYVNIISIIYETGLNSTISYLHEITEKRHSFALDIIEIFKPIICDKLLFKLLNKNIIKKSDFEYVGKACYLKDEASKLVLNELRDKLRVVKKVDKKEFSYRELIKKECYKIKKHLLSDSKIKYKGYIECI